MMKWNNKGEGKQLTPKQRLQRQKLIVYPIFAVIFIFVMYFIFVPSATRKDSIEEVNGYNLDIPVSEGDNITNDKKAAYEAEDIRQKQNERKTLEDYAFELTPREKEGKSLSLLPEKEDQATGIITSVTTYKDLTKEMQSFYQPITREDQEKKDLELQVEELKEQLQSSTPQPNQYEMMEESYKLAAKYLNPVSVQQTASTPVQNSQHENNYVFVEPERENVISMLGEMSDSAFIQSLGGKRNLGFNTVGTNKVIQRNTIRACINANQILLFGENSGAQIVQLRLLENVRIVDIIIPRNTLITGTAKLSAERVEIVVNSIKYMGNIIPVSLKICDVDGLEGLNCPGSVERSMAKDIGGNIGGSVGTSINLGNNAGEQVVADISRNVIQGVTNYMGKKLKMVKVTLKSNYIVLIVNSK